MRVAIGVVLGAALLSAGACIDAGRVNATCTWLDPVPWPLDLGKQADRDHLRMDAQVAWELAVRYGDVRYRTNPVLSGPLRRECRERLERTIIARHGVTAEAIRAVTRSRVWWIDIVAVFFPMVLLAVVATDRVVGLVRRRIGGALDAERRVVTVASMVVVVAVLALVATGVTQYWAMAIESLRLRDGHIADRVIVLPTAAHAGLTFVAAFAVCLSAAIRRVRRIA